jgi:hypothetical protein
MKRNRTAPRRVLPCLLLGLSSWQSDDDLEDDDDEEFSLGDERRGD